MSTVISARTTGHLARCDATCYNAKGKRCKCICGGMNHGKGYHHAVRATALHYDAICQRIRERFPHAPLITIRYQKWLFHPDTEPTSASSPPETLATSRSLPQEPKVPSGT